MTLIEIRAKSRKLLGGISSTAYSDDDMITSINDYQREATNLAIMATDKWVVNGDIATANIIAGQQEYVLTTTVPLQTLSRIEVNLTGATNGFTPVNIVDAQTYQGVISNSVLTGGLFPSVYFLDNSIFFVDVPDTSVVGGLKIFYSPSAIDFSNGEISAVTINTAGLNYEVDDVLTVGGAGTGATVTVSSVDAGGGITAVDITSYGAGYSIATAVAVSGGSGSGAKLNITAIETNESKLLEEAQMHMVYGACLDYAISFELVNKINIFEKKLAESREKIKKMYSNRLKASQPKITIKQIFAE